MLQGYLHSIRLSAISLIDQPHLQSRLIAIDVVSSDAVARGLRVPEIGRKIGRNSSPQGTRPLPCQENHGVKLVRTHSGWLCLAWEPFVGLGHCGSPVCLAWNLGSVPLKCLQCDDRDALRNECQQVLSYGPAEVHSPCIEFRRFQSKP
jgi:hypothetical protein